MPDAMTAFQNGHPADFCNGTFTYPVTDDIETYLRACPVTYFLATVFLRLQKPGTNTIAAYFAFLGDVIYKCPESTTLFRLTCQPYCKAYPRNDVEVTSRVYDAPLHNYLLSRDKNSEKTRELLEKLVKNGENQLGPDLASHYIHAPRHMTEIQQVSPFINISLDTLLPHLETKAAHSLLIFRLCYNIVWGTENSYITYQNIQKLYEDKELDKQYKTPLKGMLAYLTHYGIGCSPDPALAKKIIASHAKKTTWEALIGFEDKLEALLEHDDVSVMKWFFTELENQNLHFSTHPFDMDPRLMLKTSFGWMKKNLGKINKNPEFIKGFYAAMDKIFSQSPDHERRFRLFYFDMAKMGYHFPEVQPEKYLIKALENNDPDAFLFKAHALFHGKYGFVSANRTETLEEVKKLLEKVTIKKAEKKILRRLVDNEMNPTQPVAEKFDITIDSDEDDADIVKPTENSATSSDVTPEENKETATSSTSTGAKKPKVKTRKATDQVTASYSISLPDAADDDASDEDTLAFNVDKKAFEFVSMIWSASESRIHHYDVKAAASCLKALGFVCEANDNATWKFMDKAKRIHTLSFHIPHGRKENKLYPAIQTRIKRCFEKLGVTTDVVSMNK